MKQSGLMRSQRSRRRTLAALSMLSCVAMACSSGGANSDADAAGMGGQPPMGAAGTFPGGASAGNGNAAGGAASGGGIGLAGSTSSAGASGSAAGGTSNGGMLPSGGSGAVSGSDSGGGAAGSSSSGPPNFYAVASGVAEVYVNGARMGQSTGNGMLASLAAHLNEGAANDIAIRATKGGASTPYLLAEADGGFGRAGTGAYWKAKAASSADETSGSAWAAAQYDDASWPSAKDVNVAPTAAEMVSGPARGIWTSASTDQTVLFRTRLYVPSGWSANQPYGFGKGVTGGGSGSVVKVTTAAQLAAAVTGNEAKVIQISGTIDFTGSEGTLSASACYQSQCPDGTYEYIVDTLGGCTGKSTFPVNYDKAGTTPLLVGSNKTIVGVGPNATIKGKGFKLTKGVSNIIIRNLTITQINPQIVWGGDAITITGASNVWIDHNRISLIGRQFLVTGFDQASNVTVSYNDFDGSTKYPALCDGRHYWTFLFLGSNDTITMLGNYVHHTSGRSPHAGGYAGVLTNSHFVNNYYRDVGGHVIDPGSGANLLFEGNYSADEITPFALKSGAGTVYGPLASSVASTNSACTAALGRVCGANVVGQSDAKAILDSAALTAFQSLKGSLVTAYPATEVPYCVPALAGPGHI